MGITFANTPQNEPLNAYESPGMLAGFADQVEFVKNDLGPILKITF